MKIAAMICAVLVLGGCMPEALNAAGPNAPMQSTSSRRTKDPDQPRQMCQDTSMGGESRTVCY